MDPVLTRVMPLLFRLGLLPKPPIASTVAKLDDRSSTVIRPVLEPQISPDVGNLKRFVDVEFASPSSQGGKTTKLKMDILAPTGRLSAPAVVYVGGGGFIMAPKEAAQPLRAYVAEAGFVVASIQYRTIRNGATFRDGVADVKSAVRFLRANAATYGIDSQRMAIWGESAGGYLAMAALTAGDLDFDAGDNLDQSSSVQAVVDKFGASDVSRIGDDFDATTRAQPVEWRQPPSLYRSRGRIARLVGCFGRRQSTDTCHAFGSTLHDHAREPRPVDLAESDLAAA